MIRSLVTYTLTMVFATTVVLLITYITVAHALHIP